jgi:tRNA(adenine34) deaminase
MPHSNDEYYMALALQQAHKAYQLEEVPVGAVVVLNEKIIGTGFNQVIRLNDPTAHAEILAIREACQNVSNYRLIDATLYTTLEPCCMCAGAIVHARVKRLVFAASDQKAGACCSVFELLNGYPLNHKVSYQKGISEQQSVVLLKNFFKARR